MTRPPASYGAIPGRSREIASCGIPISLGNDFHALQPTPVGNLPYNVDLVK